MNITSFDDYLELARAQVEAQRLLFVFAGAELPEDASTEQRERFERDEGGELTPLMYVDKSAEELTHFDALISEAAAAGPPWSILFTAAMSGRNGALPSSVDAEAPLLRMIESIKSGQLQGLLPFDRHGKPVQFI